jgi:hypothetical protein
MTGTLDRSKSHTIEDNVPASNLLTVLVVVSPSVPRGLDGSAKSHNPSLSADEAQNSISIARVYEHLVLRVVQEEIKVGNHGVQCVTLSVINSTAQSPAGLLGVNGRLNIGSLSNKCVSVQDSDQAVKKCTRRTFKWRYLRSNK